MGLTTNSGGVVAGRWRRPGRAGAAGKPVAAGCKEADDSEVAAAGGPRRSSWRQNGLHRQVGAGGYRWRRRAIPGRVAGEGCATGCDRGSGTGCTGKPGLGAASGGGGAGLPKDAGWRGPQGDAAEDAGGGKTLPEGAGGRCRWGPG
ncbi:uncharacterized protein LOC131875072 [Cryptomeria japonica]|uniref:uncharacterized protein LOC131875072 n=1 Tax=Cryptomeria japonica TaxID=3369 RepID=UPI0027DA13C8|nr:uncharacterized protein LOC131875072 [Cryptomeria japonica]